MGGAAGHLPVGGAALPTKELSCEQSVVPQAIHAEIILTDPNLQPVLHIKANLFFFLHGISGGGVVSKLCLTLATLWIAVLQAPLSMGFSRQKYWSGLLFPSPGDLPNRVSCIAGGFFTSELLGKTSQALLGFPGMPLPWELRHGCFSLGLCFGKAPK